MPEQPRHTATRGVPRPSRLRGIVARLLCLLVLPISLVVGTANMAAAATHYGDVVQVTHVFEDGFPSATVMTCTANIYYAVDAVSTSVIGEGVCWDDWSTFVDEGDSSVRVDFKGVVPGTSDLCVMYGGTNNLDGWDFQVGNQWPGLCDVTEICWSAEIALRFAPDVTKADECEAVDLGEYPTITGTGDCPVGNIVSAAAELDLANARWRVNFTWSGTINSGATFSAQVWTSGHAGYSATQDWNYDNAAHDWAAGSATTGWKSWNLGNTQIAGLRIGPRNFNSGTNNPALSAAEAEVVYGPLYQTPIETPPGPKGATIQEGCNWWFGPKIVNDPNNTWDEPAGDLQGGSNNNTTDPNPGPPSPENDDCTFSITDPSTWLEGGMCAAVGLLGQIWGTLKNIAAAIANLAGAIVSGIGSLLDDLFIPDPDAWGLDELWDTAQSKPPFSLLAGLVDGVNAAVDSFGAGGCDGGLYEIENTQVLPCDGPDVPNWGAVYTVATVGLWITTGLIVWNMLAGAIRKGGDD